MNLALALLAALSLTVTDGDTVRLGDERIRLIGVDTPEVRRPKCKAEKMLGDRATIYVKARLATAKDVQINRDGVDRYGRTLAHVVLDGEDLGKALIDAGLGMEYYGGRRGWKWC
ncbi:MAG: nuclease [Alphaproteobacteria bacterium]|nr:MAG: nuclease [Alphaproteobacteria bacterium]